MSHTFINFREMLMDVFNSFVPVRQNLNVKVDEVFSNMEVYIGFLFNVTLI